jgi:uncharacterized iron-regulated membrane protein
VTSSLALHGSPRRWVTRLHRWSGLAIMACMLVAAITGTWLVFRVELDRLVNPHLRVVEPGPTRVSLAALVDTVEAHVPHSAVQALTLQERPDDAVGVYLRSTNGAELDLNQLFVNPYTGAILGGRSTTHLVFAREYVDPIVDRLHYSLLMNGFGLWLMGIVAGVWMVTSVIGLALAWPRRWLRLAAWSPALAARFDRGAYQANYRAHRATGVWLLPVLVLLSFTSLYQNLPQLVRPVVNAFSRLAERPAGRPVAPDQAIISPDRAVDGLAAQFPSARASSIGVDRFAGRYSILFHLPGDLSPLGDNWAFVDLISGRIVGTKLNASSSAGDRFLAWIFPLHTGTAFGTPGRIVIAIGGVGVIALIVTGFYIWWTKWRMRYRARVRARLHAPARAAS